ncbi:HAD-IA family hydrolase [Cohnella sp. 56]|uniref:HAD-IA family hydrolase n=1 Tax=Cohnella sp. 56 TaxID=3113722 RepID=UPI0030E7C981
MVEAKPQLVLDIAGVLVNNFSPVIWKELGDRSGVIFEAMRTQFLEIKRDLWTGSLTEEQFWIGMVERYPSLNRDKVKDHLIETLKPLPAVQYLEQWSRIADIHLLSNHCWQWLEPSLAIFKKHTKSITISNQVGLCKPDIRIYELVESHFRSKAQILYIDDQDKNLQPAKLLGWNTLLADNQNQWIDEVELKLLAN